MTEEEERQATRSPLRTATWGNDGKLWRASKVLGSVRPQGQQFLAVAQDGHSIGTFPTVAIARAMVEHQADVQTGS